MAFFVRRSFPSRVPVRVFTEYRSDKDGANSDGDRGSKKDRFPASGGTRKMETARTDAPGFSCATGQNPKAQDSILSYGTKQKSGSFRQEALMS